MADAVVLAKDNKALDELEASILELLCRYSLDEHVEAIRVAGAAITTYVLDGIRVEVKACCGGQSFEVFVYDRDLDAGEEKLRTKVICGEDSKMDCVYTAVRAFILQDLFLRAGYSFPDQSGSELRLPL